MTLADKSVEYTRRPMAKQICRLLPSASEDAIVAVLASPLGDMIYRGLLGLTLELLPLKALSQEKGSLASMLRSQAMSKVMNEMVEVVAGPLMLALEHAKDMEKLKEGMDDPDVLLEE
jgi:hypothetical protein